MSKNIVKIILERKMNIEENIVNNIMDYHGDIDKMLPEGNFPESIKRCMRMNNWVLTKEKDARSGGLTNLYYVEKYYIEIKIDKNNLWSVFKNNVDVIYGYPTKYGKMTGEKQIINIENDLIQFDKYKLKLDRFDYLQIKHIYKQIDVFQHSTN